jgi:ElaB/YqjD/DUF883 family membrane-anchored ribosome-binding protein
MATNLQIERKSFSDQTTKIGEDVREISAATKQLAADSVDAVQQTAGQLIDEGRSRALGAIENAQGKVKEKPVKSVLIAAAVGFLFGVFWRSR